MPPAISNPASPRIHDVAAAPVWAREPAEAFGDATTVPSADGASEERVVDVPVTIRLSFDPPWVLSFGSSMAVGGVSVNGPWASLLPVPASCPVASMRRKGAPSRTSPAASFLVTATDRLRTGRMRKKDL
ncbi:hypothetical protein ACFYTG_20470 [Streptomyces mirabilis]|uniref:hypothetical protein n=1 Tax=Streptomyces mirabilis TaxID=68239 RepID=UPI0036CC06B7